MTKNVRIENADLGTDKIIEIKIFRVIPGEPDVLERVETLPFPTAMTTIALTTNNRIELRELVKEN